MPSYNQVRFLRTSIESILEQSYSEVELIVSDGGSTDGSAALLDEISKSDPRLTWWSEQDAGPAHAINKALSRVRGEYVGWLNSDDLYVAGAFKRAIDGFQNNPDWIMIYGHGEHIDATGSFLNRYPTQTPNVGMKGFQKGSFICQPTVFFKSVMLSLVGCLDQNLRTAFDYDLWLRAFSSFADRIGFVDQVQAQSRLHADCITQTSREVVALEGLQLGLRYFGESQPHWASTYLEELGWELGADKSTFLAQSEQFLQKASRYLSEQDKQGLRSAIQYIDR
ncbi:MAG: glycosyltransferase family 2 protein [Pseudomonadota bacterium]